MEEFPMRLSAATLALACAISAHAQWFDYQKKGMPRLANGKVNMTAPAPKQADGKPDLSGVWLGDNWQPAGRRPNLPPEARGQMAKMLPAAQKEFDRRRESNLKDDPKVRCMPNGVPHSGTEPYPFEIIHTPEKTLFLYEMYSLRRSIFTDGRELPANPQEFTPTWMGYSVGKWEGDEFVIHTTGFNSKVWALDMAGHPSSDAMHVYERYKRVDFGHMDVSITIDDPKTFESKWTQNLRYTLLPDTDILEFICEVNPSVEHMVGK
jgi:hypothetical protein